MLDQTSQEEREEVESRHPENRGGVGGIFEAFGTDTEFLVGEKAKASTKEERIKSVWPFLVGEARKFWKTLHPRERANCDAEDAVSVLYIAVSERDHKWDPEKGEYISFVGPIVHNALYRLREECRTIPSPRNSSCRLNDYRAASESGNLTAAQARTMEDINRTISGTSSFGESVPHLEDPSVVDKEADAAESRAVAAEAVRLAMETLTSPEAAIVGFINGLWGGQEKTIKEISVETGNSQEHVRRIKRRAYGKILCFLESTGSPAAHVDRNTSEPDFGDETF